MMARITQYGPLAGAWLCGDFLVLVIPVQAPAAMHTGWAQLLFTLGTGLLLGAALFALAALLSRPQAPSPAAPRPVRRFAWLGYALPMLVSGLVYLLALWPGLMSQDSYDQWSQPVNGQFSNTHPVFHTLILLALRQVWDSPAMIALAQIAALALAAGVALARLERHGARRSLLWLSAFLLALSPLNGGMAVTLWKDVFYAAAFLGFFICLAEMVFTRGEWAGKSAHLALAAALALLTALLRHNGAPVVSGTLLVFGLAYVRQRARLLASAAAVFAVWVAVNGPLYSALGVMPMITRAQIPAHHIAAHLAAGTPLTSEQKTFLERVMPLKSKWKYSCYNSEDTFYSPQFDRAYADQHLGQLNGIFLALLRSNPRVDLRTLLCVSSAAWRVTFPPDSEVRIVPLPREGDPVSEKLARDFGIRRRSYLPALQPWLVDWVRGSARPAWIWLIWRPAFYFYLFVFGVAVKARRERDASFLLLAVPLAIQMGLMFLLSINQDLRLHYPVIVIGALYAPYLLGDRRLSAIPGRAAGG
jgi:hypothetical protein